jgi:hypothetical protein
VGVLTWIGIRGGRWVITDVRTVSGKWVFSEENEKSGEKRIEIKYRRSFDE